MENENFVISFLLLFLFWKRNGNEKALFLPLFLLSFLLFQTSSFSFFLLFGEKMRGNGERWEDKEDCLLEDKRNLQEQSMSQQNQIAHI